MIDYRTTKGDTKHMVGTRPVTLPDDTLIVVTPADNLPDDSPIKYWVQRIVGIENLPDAEYLQAAIDGYGIGLHADDVK